MKWLGMGLVVLCGGGIGWLQYLRLQRRVATLKRCGKLLSRLSQRIRYTALPLEPLLRELAYTEEFRGFPLLPTTDTTASVREQWVAVLTRRGSEQGLAPEDMTLLCTFATQLGKSDTAGQLQLCEEYGALLQDQLEIAREALATKGRLCLTLGLCGGIVVVLLLW